MLKNFFLKGEIIRLQHLSQMGGNKISNISNICDLIHVGNTNNAKHDNILFKS
jgi:hypothetical protein